METHPSWQEIKDKVDFAGAFLLVSAISIQLVGLSLGGNELPWSNGWVIGSLVLSVVLLGVFVWVEAKTTTIPVIPLRMLRGRNPIAIQTANVCAGLAAYAVRKLALHIYLHTNPGCSIYSCFPCSSKSCSKIPLQKPELDSPSHR